MIYADNYRDILKDLISKRTRGEITRIAEHLDVASTLLSQVLSGSRHLTLEQSYSVANYFGLADQEKDYFLASVHKDRALNDDLKKYWGSKLSELKISSQSVRKKVKAQKELDDPAKSKFYSSYMYSAIRLFCSVDEGKTIDEICEKFKITRQKALDMLQFLLEQNLVTEKKGRYQMGVQNTHVPKESDYVYRHHSNWRLKSLSRIDSVKDDELSFTCPCSIDQATFNELKSDILELIEKAVQKAHAAPAKDVACITIDLFHVDS